MAHKGTVLFSARVRLGSRRPTTTVSAPAHDKKQHGSQNQLHTVLGLFGADGDDDARAAVLSSPQFFVPLQAAHDIASPPGLGLAGSACCVPRLTDMGSSRCGEAAAAGWWIEELMLSSAEAASAFNAQRRSAVTIDFTCTGINKYLSTVIH